MSLHSSEDELSADELEAKHEKRRKMMERRRKKEKERDGLCPSGSSRSRNSGLSVERTEEK